MFLQAAKKYYQHHIFKFLQQFAQGSIFDLPFSAEPLIRTWFWEGTTGIYNFDKIEFLPLKNSLIRLPLLWDEYKGTHLLWEKRSISSFYNMADFQTKWDVMSNNWMHLTRNNWVSTLFRDLSNKCDVNSLKIYKNPLQFMSSKLFKQFNETNWNHFVLIWALGTLSCSCSSWLFQPLRL